MNSNANHPNQPYSANIYYGTGPDTGRGMNNQQDHEVGMGYQYLNDNNENNNPNSRNNPSNSGNLNYPQTGLTIPDPNPQETSTEFILPPNVKSGMMCCSIFCFFLFFVAMLIR